jgi:hypothetical protein
LRLITWLAGSLCTRKGREIHRGADLLTSHRYLAGGHRYTATKK